MKSPEFPISIERGVVKIYHTPQRVGGTEYDAFTITYLSGGKRLRKKFSDLAAAKREGKAIAAKIYGKEHDLLQMSSADRTNYFLATDNLKRTGIPLPLAATEYAKAWDILIGGSLSVVDHSIEGSAQKLRIFHRKRRRQKCRHVLHESALAAEDRRLRDELPVYLVAQREHVL